MSFSVLCLLCLCVRRFICALWSPAGLSPYLCFISLLYLDLYVLGDDALIS